MIKFEIGDTLVGKINGCRIKILDIYHFERMDGSKEMLVKYENEETKEKGEAPLDRLQRSHFDVVHPSRKEKPNATI